MALSIDIDIITTHCDDDMGYHSGSIYVFVIRNNVT